MTLSPEQIKDRVEKLCAMGIDRETAENAMARWNDGTFPDPRSSERIWFCYSTSLCESWLMLECRKTGAQGVVKLSTPEEWSWAYTCPSNPRRWVDNARVTLMHEGTDL